MNNHIIEGPIVPELLKCSVSGCMQYTPSNSRLCTYHALGVATTSNPIASKYPKYYKALPVGETHIDVYMVHSLFGIDDASGAIQHASKKLLLSGVRTGNKTKRQDIQEAVDTLNRWLDMNPKT